MFANLLGLFSNDLAIDLGASNTRLFVRGRGIVVNEPSVVAVQTAPGGKREVEATEFYQGAYFTALEPGELLTEVSIPLPPAGHGYAYEKLKRKVGDYATAAAAVVLTMAGGKVATCAIAGSGGVSPWRAGRVGAGDVPLRRSGSGGTGSGQW